MHAIGLSSIVPGSIVLAVTLLTVAGADAADNRWCATYTKPSAENCTFSTFAQCQAQVSGIGGWCRPNPFPDTAFGTSRNWSNPPRRGGY
jgi:hypothetical protein